jgi:hypothetical protein
MSMAIKSNSSGVMLLAACAVVFVILLSFGGIAVAVGVFFMLLLVWLVIEVVNLDNH